MPAGDVVPLTREERAGASEPRLCAAGTGLRARLCAGRPLCEPVAARGPSVMNPLAAVAQAYAGSRAGGFGPE